MNDLKSYKMNHNTEIILNGEDFASFRERIIEECEAAGACEEEFERLLKADNAEDFFQVLIDNHNWCMLNGLITIEQVCKLEGLKLLYCSCNQLSILPEFPDGLMEIYCYNNKLTCLPALPNELMELWCSDNQLTSLPTLPEGLTRLYCHNNQLTTLPTLPVTLAGLDCSNNNLSSLPELSDILTWLYCSNNPQLIIESVPTSLKELWCNKSHLSPNFKAHDGLSIYYV